tara:strand:- start:206 stop:1033 length:828 start_codon:yes stop_codon:yes gene_type:complete
VKKKPLVSVLMTIFNHQNFLNQSIKSVIDQKYQNWELIAIDNGSTDNSGKILKKKKDERIIKKFLKKDIGRTNCLNFGLKLCKGELVAILDSDDVMDKYRIYFQVNEFLKNKYLGIVASDYNFINSHGKKFFFPKEYYDINRGLQEKPRIYLYRNIFAHSSIMFKKKLVKKIGGYPSEFLYGQDYALILKILNKYEGKILKKKLVNIRILHKSSEGMRIAKTNQANFEKVKILTWTLSNYKTTLFEKILIINNLILTFVKIFLTFVKILINKIQG